VRKIRVDIDIPMLLEEKKNGNRKGKLITSTTVNRIITKKRCAYE